jgi:hypothetical protein
MINTEASNVAADLKTRPNHVKKFSSKTNETNCRTEHPRKSAPSAVTQVFISFARLFHRVNNSAGSQTQLPIAMIESRAGGAGDSGTARPTSSITRHLRPNRSRHPSKTLSYICAPSVGFKRYLRPWIQTQPNMWKPDTSDSTLQNLNALFRTCYNYISESAKTINERNPT